MPDDILYATIGEAAPWYGEWREHVKRSVQGREFTKLVMAGDRATLKAFLQDYWPFVGFCGGLIRKRELAANELLRRGHGPTIERIERQRTLIRDVDGSHSQLWRQLAASMDITIGPSAEEPTPAMRALLEKLRRMGHPAFHAALATIEIIAWALSDLAYCSPLYQMAHSRWFGVHLAPYRPTNEEMYRFVALRLFELGGKREPCAAFVRSGKKTLPLFLAVADEAWVEPA